MQPSLLVNLPASSFLRPHPHPVTMLPPGACKRSRDDALADDADDHAADTQRHTKCRTLPFRTSPATKNANLIADTSAFSTLTPISFPRPPPMTPVSDDDDQNCASVTTAGSPCHRPTPPTLPLHNIHRVRSMQSVSFWNGINDTDMTMADMQQSITSPAGAESKAEDTADLPMSDIPDIPQQAPPNESQPPYLNYFLRLTDGENWWQPRRPPSPVSEDEISPTTTSPVAMRQMLVEGTPTSPFASLPSAPSPASIQPPSQPQSQSHSGNRFTVAMGYRADCEKCRQHVPGHYNHIIRS